MIYSRRCTYLLLFRGRSHWRNVQLDYTARWSPNSKQPSIVLVHQQLHLCDLLPVINITCPVQIGHYSIVYRNSISTILPPVSLHLVLIIIKLNTLYDIGILLFPFHISRPVQQSGPLYQRLCSHNNMINNIIIAGDKIFSHNFNAFQFKYL